MKKISILVLSLLTFHVASAQVQSDSVDKAMEQKLSVLSQQLETYQRLLDQSDLKRKEDSLVRANLMERLQLLQATANDESLSERAKYDSIQEAEQKQRTLELRGDTKGFNVNPIDDSLFVIYTRLGHVKPEERAANVSEKIEILVKSDFFFPDSLYIKDHDSTLDIMYKGLIVTSISDWDAFWVQGEDKHSLARIYKDQISDFVIRTRNQSTIENLAARIGLVFLIIGGVVLILYFIRKLASGIQGWMVISKNKYFTGFKIRNFELLPPSLHLDASIRAISIVKWGLYVLVFYLSLPLIFGLFPFTRGWAQNLMDWILDPAKNIWFGFWNYIPNVFTIAVIYLITRYLVKFLRFIAEGVENGTLNLSGFYTDWAMPTYRLAKILIYVFMVVMIYPYLPGSDSDIFKGVSIFLGLLIAFGSTSAVSNVVAGLAITYIRPFRVGDRVKIGEVTGEIMSKALLVTRVRTTKNEDITVPNSSILTGHTVNYTSSSKELGLILNTAITIGYDVPWRKVHEQLIEAAVVTDGVNVSKEPFVLQTSLDDWYVSYQLNAYTDTPEQMPKIYSALHSNIQDKFKEAGIEIMSPHYRAVRDGNETTIPKSIN
ncbi:MAG: mechanosensitive ion channel family protein [Ekhidna sp.]